LSQKHSFTKNPLRSLRSLRLKHACPKRTTNHRSARPVWRFRGLDSGGRLAPGAPRPPKSRLAGDEGGSFTPWETHLQRSGHMISARRRMSISFPSGTGRKLAANLTIGRFWAIVPTWSRAAMLSTAQLNGLEGLGSSLCRDCIRTTSWMRSRAPTTS
jgi:hypothetical protein